MRYYATYKCPLCGTILKCGDSVELPEYMLTEALAKFVQNQRMIGADSYFAPMFIPHRCKDGNAGLAHFIGLTKECLYEKKRA